jgi:hypothetical protein
MGVRYRLSLSLVLLVLSMPVWAARKVELNYHVTLLPGSEQAEVRVSLGEGSAVRSLDFDLGSEAVYSGFQADGKWSTSADTHHGVWQPTAGAASLTYKVQLNHRLKSGSFDSRITPQWALLRGEQLVPPVRVDPSSDTQWVSRLEFELPEGWKSVETAWPRIGKQRFRLDNSAKALQRPTGWMVAGKVGSRRARLGDTEVTVAAPRGQGMRRMDTLTLLTFVWPQVQAVFPRQPVKLLVVGAAAPMWRGVQAANDSIYLNTALPLVNEQGASTLVRELVRVLARLCDEDRSAWISQGLAEYYAIELVKRAGGLSDDRAQHLQARMIKLGRPVTTLRGQAIDAAGVARAVLLLQELDAEIRLKTRDQRSLDDVMRGLMRMDAVSTQAFVALSENLLGGKSRVLDSKLLD